MLQIYKNILRITQALLDNTTELYAVHVVTHLNHICSIATSNYVLPLTQVASLRNIPTLGFSCL